jgi:hypothetical protein
MSEMARTSAAIPASKQLNFEVQFSLRLLELSLLIDHLPMEERAGLLTSYVNERALSRWFPDRVVEWVIELGPIEKKQVLKNASLAALLSEHIHAFDIIRWESQ